MSSSNSFQRDNREGWMLAMSLACPKCHGRLYGDQKYAWCKAFDCDFYCQWSHLDWVFQFNDNALYTEDARGSIHRISKNHYKIFYEKESEGRLYKRRG